MSQELTLFLVDDALPARRLLESAFRADYRVTSFASAEECLSALNDGVTGPDLFLLDVDLPTMNGYDLCRQIKSNATLKSIPVIFVSGLDDLDSRLEGYGAGGIDYIPKPYNIPELRQKIAACLLLARNDALKGRLAESEMLASQAMSALDEYAILVRFLRSLNECGDIGAIVDYLLRMLGHFGLQTAIQIRLPGFEMTYSANGTNLPLEVSVVNHVRKLGRIFEFKTRAAYNFECLTILVNNVPHQDPDLCGRLRDHLAIAAEAANAKLTDLQTRAAYSHAKQLASDLLGRLQRAMADFESGFLDARYRGTVATQAMLDELARALAALGLSEDQESVIDQIVRTGTESLASIHDFSGETREAISDITRRIALILSPPAPVTAPLTAPAGEPAPPEVSRSVELF